jgi:formylglycine-generating enzyme required for sulfatase activity
LRANDASGIKEAFAKQELLYYFDVLNNGPVYPELVKDFWMKAVIVTKKDYNEYI